MLQKVLLKQNTRFFLWVKILLKYKESVPDRTKITVEFGSTGVHISYIPASSCVIIASWLIYVEIDRL